MYISRHEIHDISDRTYFQKPEEIIHGLREVVQILSSWKSDKLLLSFHLSFSVDFRRSSGQKSRKILSIGRPFTSWRLRTARNARDSDWKVLWVFLCRNAGPLANACVRLRWLDPVFWGGYHPTLKLSVIPTFTFIVSLTHRMDSI